MTSSLIRRLRYASLACAAIGALPLYSPLAKADAAPSAAIQELRRRFNDASLNVLTFHNIDSIFETIPVAAGGTPWRLDSAPATPAFTYSVDGQRYAFEDVFERTFTNALLIIKNDRLVFERYRNYTGQSTRFLSMSMAKSLTSILIGAALQDGAIKSIDEQIVAYAPELRGSAYDGATIEDLLLMKSGVDASDNYRPEPGSPLAQAREDSMVMNRTRVLEQAKTAKRADAPGKTFRYYTMNTNVLGRVLEAATGKPLAQYMSERLWKPLGAEAGGFWMADGPEGIGKPINGMGFNATARDYARVGLMMLHEGKANGRQIVPAAWVKKSTVPEDPEPASAEFGMGYQYQWWTLVNSNAYMAVGLQGQFIYVDPDTRTVVVKLSYFPLANQTASKETEMFFRAVSAWPGK